MKTNKVFLVNDPIWGSKVITASSFEKDVNEKVKDIEIKPKYIEAYVTDALKDLTGKALEQAQYDEVLNDARYALDLFMTLSPYTFFRDYVSQIKD